MNGQRTLTGEAIPDPDPSEPDEPDDDSLPVKPCDVCDNEFPLTGEPGGAIEHGGQVLCGDCMSVPVVFEARCECWSCDWTYRSEGREFNRYAVRQRIQQEANIHTTERRVFDGDHFHTTNWREVEP